MSIASNQPVATEVLTAVGNTLRLALVATLIGFVLGRLLGLCRVTFADHGQTGCAFAPRCKLATAACHAAQPDVVEFEPGHRARCIHTNVPQPA